MSKETLEALIASEIAVIEFDLDIMSEEDDSNVSIDPDFDDFHTLY